MYRQLLALASVFCFISCSSTSKIPDSISYSTEIEHFRKEYQADFLKDTRSPLVEEDFQYMHFFEADESYKCNCEFTLTPESKPFELSTYSGNTKPFRQHGVATCTIKGINIQIHLYESILSRAMPGYENHLFVPFKDTTSGEASYGGGRYIDMLTTDIQNGMVQVDFNRSYNPWCAYSDGYNCPIPPLENHLNIAIEAGEKMWTGKKKK